MRLPVSDLLRTFLLCTLLALIPLQRCYSQATPPPAAPGGNPAQPAASPAATPDQPTQARPVTHDYLDARMSLGDGKIEWHPTRKQIGLSFAPGCDNQSAADELKFNVDQSALKGYLTLIAPYVRRAPINARPVLGGAHSINPISVRSSSVPAPAKILPSVDGAVLEVDQAATAIAIAIDQNPIVKHIVLPIKQTTPRVTGTQLEGIDARVGHFVTHFNPFERGRTQTVRLAILKVNNSIVEPGAVFSLNQTVGERTAARGFGMGIVFVDGHLDTQLGGGMCQVGTTLFNAVLLAGLKVVERYQHVRTVPYVPPGDDATVYWGVKDFQFQNDTQTPIYIAYSTTATHAICDLYGKGQPDVMVRVVDLYKRLGPRHYTAVLRRFVTQNGKTTNDYTAFSAYKWTPKLDYTM